MKRLKWLLFSFILSAVFYSCSSDFDIIGEYEDLTIVYGILDGGQDTHYIKVNKAFLGTGNANEYAQVADSSTYPDILDVKLERLDDNRIDSIIPFERVVVGGKEDGDFFGPEQVLYRSIGQLKSENEQQQDYTYKLSITNTQTNKLVTAQAELVGDFRITKPQISNVNFQTKNRPTSFKWEMAPNGRKYQAEIDFYYTEISNNNNNEVVKMMKWAGIGNYDQDYDPMIIMEASAKHDVFFGLIENNVPYDDQEQEDSIDHRIADSVIFRVSVAGDDLATFLDVTNLSTGLSEETPEYSNIDNGRGVFSSRRQAERRYFISPLTVEELKTYPYKFKLRSEIHEK